MKGLEAALPTYKTVVKPNTMFCEDGRKSVATGELKIAEIVEFYDHDFMNIPMERPGHDKRLRPHGCRSVNTEYFWVNGMKGRRGGCDLWEFDRSLPGCQYRVAWDI